MLILSIWLAQINQLFIKTFPHKKSIHNKLNKMYKIKAMGTKELRIDKISDKITTNSKLTVTFEWGIQTKATI